MTMLDGYYYDGRRPIAAAARLELGPREAVLYADCLVERYAIDRLTVSPETGGADRFIDLPDGGQFQCADLAALDVLPQASPSEGPVAWLEARWGMALAGVLVVAGILLTGYFYGLPRAAERIAKRIPIGTEEALGRQALRWLDEKGWFASSNLDATTQDGIRAGFERLRSDLPLKDHYRLELRSSPMIGANAFALPGGTIVLTDEMVLLSDSREEVLAVLAHEIGHEEMRHSLRSILQNSAVAVAAAAVTSDAASLSAAVAGLPVLLAQTKYSREFEAAADDFAFDLLKQKGQSPEAFAAIMERLSKKEGFAGSMSYISTHPVTKERVRRAREAAGM